MVFFEPLIFISVEIKLKHEKREVGRVKYF